MSINKLFLVLFTVMTFGVCNAQYGFYVDDYEVSDTEVGSVIQMSLKAQYNSLATSSLIRIQLPEGLELIYVDEDGYDVCYTPGKDWPQRYMLDMRKSANNEYYIVFWSMYDYSQRVQEATLYRDVFRLFVRINNGFSGGFIDVSTEYVNCDRIVPATEWSWNQYDVNNDGEVNIPDVNVVRDNILYARAYSSNCDVNKDGRVDVIDLDALVDCITASSSGGPFAGYQLVMTYNRARIGMVDTESGNVGDLNDDGKVSIADVTALINYLLSGHW